MRQFHVKIQVTISQLRGEHFLLKLFGNEVEWVGAPFCGRNDRIVVRSNLTVIMLLNARQRTSRQFCLFTCSVCLRKVAYSTKQRVF